MTDAPTNVIGVDTTAAPEDKTARIVSEAPREKVVPLAWPIEFGGKTYSEVRIKRVSGKEMRDFVNKLQAGENSVPPVFDIPIEVYDAMDADDADMLDKEGLDFLPRSLRLWAGE